jgi:hypothetical protein
MSRAASQQIPGRARACAWSPRRLIAIGVAATRSRKPVTIGVAATRPRKPVTIGVAALTAIALAACGNADKKQTSGTYAGEGGAAAPYLSVGPLAYQVQISRTLNPNDTEDSAFLQGLSPKQRELQPGEEWFGVFMQVYDESGASHEDAREITIHDTEGNVYKPVEPNQYNLYAYRPGATVPSKDQLPLPSSTAASGAVNGLLLLYRLKLTSLENRPLTVKIVSPTDPTKTASAELDS